MIKLLTISHAINSAATKARPFNISISVSLFSLIVFNITLIFSMPKYTNPISGIQIFWQLFWKKILFTPNYF